MELAKELQKIEERLLESAVRSDARQLDDILCDEFREYGASGRVFTKAQIVADLTAETPEGLSLKDFRCEAVAEGVALVTYRSVRQTQSGEVASLRSSLWVQRKGVWQMLFHQGTRAALERLPADGETTSG